MAGAAAAGILKKSTGLTGLNVVVNPEHHYQMTLGKIMRVLNVIPPTSAYRKYTEEIVSNRMQIVKNSKNVTEIEMKINCGQIEELIKQADYELILARKLLKWKPWEELVCKAPENQWNWPPVK